MDARQSISDAVRALFALWPDVLFSHRSEVYNQ